MKPNHNSCCKNVVKMHIIGDEKVGKTCFMKCAVYGQSDIFQQSSVGVDFLSQKVLVKDEEVLLQLWEIDPPSYTCLIFMYDVTSRETFQHAIEKLLEVRTKNSEVPVLLVGNKVDMEAGRCVMSYEGELIALEYQTLFSEVTCQVASTVRESVIEFMKSVI